MFNHTTTSALLAASVCFAAASLASAGAPIGDAIDAKASADAAPGLNNESDAKRQAPSDDLVTYFVADIDRNGDLDFMDIVAMLSVWGDCAGCTADITADGVVDINDLVMLLSYYAGGEPKVEVRPERPRYIPRFQLIDVKARIAFGS
jgi:hypothetical protein